MGFPPAAWTASQRSNALGGPPSRGEKVNNITKLRQRWRRVRGGASSEMVGKEERFPPALRTERDRLRCAPPKPGPEAGVFEPTFQCRGFEPLHGRNPIKKRPQGALFYWVADREGFEPSVEFPLHTRSRRAPSTTRSPVHTGRRSPCAEGGLYTHARKMSKSRRPFFSFKLACGGQGPAIAHPFFICLPILPFSA